MSVLTTIVSKSGRSTQYILENEFHKIKTVKAKKRGI